MLFDFEAVRDPVMLDHAGRHLVSLSPTHLTTFWNCGQLGVWTNLYGNLNIIPPKPSQGCKRIGKTKTLLIPLNACGLQFSLNPLHSTGLASIRTNISMASSTILAFPNCSQKHQALMGKSPNKILPNASKCLDV